MPLLAVNVDHVATVRQARLGQSPDPVAAAAMAELAGARAIIVHLREDRRHIQDRDVRLLRQTIKTRLHLEMAATDEMRGIALELKPDMVCLVPEKRRELTTEGGLGVAGREKELAAFVDELAEAGIPTSLFIDPDPRQIDASVDVGAAYVELHTGAYSDATTRETRQAELDRLLAAIPQARRAGLGVNLGHGLDYDNIYAFKGTSGISEYSIGHSIIARAIMTGITEAVSTMAAIVAGFPD
ncbi:pyridoxal phosphate biosynthetic protein PdxJ [Solidesulfovibrio fructosivorans JJ]]|uniref:Pyridoxine 5'-phosphate synthase n=1 Tax=Solidesulfovibrio fructosivorans JJ] TaxID=596151 RepID=E1JWD2_SOLFR|nr:pyridoxine 5'-phosphate synthase [Solidesulfovibrio fructosivorans]EFL51229.1 pyridoxal phosphate biosynthetic protein PdxJ [Solidesulfovibrio fructosivorans JJ]]